jgi:3-deoxy-D-manno-octulosonic-acid transferase
MLYILFLPVLLAWTALSRLQGHPPRKGLKERLGYGKTLPTSDKRVLLHAVSVGEVNAIRTLVFNLDKSGYDVVVCVTTDSGIKRAQELFGAKHTVTRFPLDFSFAIKRFLSRIQPSIIALVELEIWPNLISISSQKNIPIVVINGRLSLRSYKRYKLAKCLLRKTFSRIAAIGMQNKEYAMRVRDLGGENVSVQGTMKWDNAILSDFVEGAKEFAAQFGIDTTKQLVVAGSTTPEEHELLLSSIPDNTQLLCAPRRHNWFDEAEQQLAPCNRRTSDVRVKTHLFLLDTIGELDKAYALADIVVIGRSFSPLHGSDPVQSIALGKPTIIGPNASDFKDMVQLLVDGNGLIQCDKTNLSNVIEELLSNKSACKSLVKNGRAIISSQQGATKRYEQLIMDNTPHA